MNGSIISVKRTPKELVVVLSRRYHKFYKALYKDDLVKLTEIYGFAEEPIASVQKVWPKYYKAVDRSWQAISHVRAWDADLLYHVLAVLVRTVPVFPEKNLRLPVLDLEMGPPVPKKTAANPRGVLTKKGKKQKPKLLPEIDLRPYLCDPKNVSAILYKLKPFWQETVLRFQKTNPSIFSSDKPPVFTVEPYMTFRHTGSSQVKRTELPRPFVQYLLFRLWYLPWKKVKPFLSLYHELGLECDEMLLSAVARLLSYNKLDQALVWLQITRDLPSGKRYSFLLTLLETNAHNIDFDKYPPKQIGDLAEMIPYEFLERRLEEMFWTFRQNVSIEYFAGGFQLATKYGWNYVLDLAHDCPAYPIEDMENLFQWAKVEDWMALALWKRFGRFKEWERWIFRPELKRLSPEAACRYIKILLALTNGRTSKSVKKRDLIFFQKNIDDQLKSLDPKIHKSFLDHLREFALIWKDLKIFNRNLKPTYELLVKLTQLPIPFPKMSNLYLLSIFIGFLPVAHRKKWIGSPDSSFIKLEKACRTENKKRLITYGLDSLIELCPEFTVNAFSQFPGKLIQSSKKLGILSFAKKMQTIKQFSRHQLLKVNLEKISSKQLFRLVEKHYQVGMSHPVPKKLQSHYNDETKLSNARIQAYHEKSKKNFLSFVLDILDQQTEETLSRPYSITHKNKNLEHSLQFYNWVTRNRRGFKNWFKAYLGGNDHYIESHPETKKWFAKHKKINKKLWNQGVLFCRRTEKYGPVRIELESDPQEILKMGTYVGSCLSLGGHYAYSAVAVLLDLNKQVLYARDSDDKILGRQLIAISKNDRLVCFNVYPENASAEIKNLFFEYDIDFAKSLNITLYEAKYSKDDKGYVIENILSNDWWDDYPWAKIAAD